MDTTRFTRLAGVAGVALFLGLVARIILSPDTGNPGDSTALIVSKLAHHRTGALVNAWAGGMLGVLLILFAAGLCEAFARRGESGLARFAFGCALVAVVMILMNNAATTTLAYEAPRAGADSAARALFDLAQVFEVAVRFPLIGFFAAAGIAGLRTGVVGRGLAAAALAIAVLDIVAGGAVARSGPLAVDGPITVLALITLGLWVLAAAVQLLRGRERVSASVPVTA